MKARILSIALLLSLSACDILQQAAQLNPIPTESEVVAGLKEALRNGTGNGADLLAKPGAFFNNSLIKILFPPEVASMEQKLRAIGLGSEVDRAVKALNEGAEKAMLQAKPIFVNAISNMSFSDAMGILKGGQGAATNYLRNTTGAALRVAFKPSIAEALNSVGATRYWGDLTAAYNKIPLVKPVTTDLEGYVTEKATQALFAEIEKEENAIRSNPAKRGSELLKKVFNYADLQGS
jgi:hypothetical protein